MTQKNIEGLIYYDVGGNKYCFATFPKDYFDEGVWRGEHIHYIFVCDHTLTFDLPEGFDTVTPQLNALDAKEKELKIQYHQALEHIKLQRNNLLAIEGQLMTTETILPELIGTLAALPEHTQKTIKAYGAACYRTALHSPEIQALRKDAGRYRWLRDTLHNAKAGGGVEVNDALQVYETPVQGEEVRVYWYQDTPVGFYQSEATTLDGDIDNVMEQKT